MSYASARAAMPHMLVVLLLALLPLRSAAQEQGRDGDLVQGVVRDVLTGAGVAGVHVTAGRRETLTDESGAFTLRANAGDVLHFHRIGYWTGQVPVSAFTGVVLLETRPTLLDRISVRGEAGEIAAGTALAVATANRADLDASAATSVAAALRELEGVAVAGTGAWGSRAVLRGLGGERVAVMIDGSRVSRACTFGMDQGLATVDPATVERVEILSGPGSTLYGSGSIGGVINVVTRRGKSDRPLAGEVRATASSGVPGGSLGGSLWLRRGDWDVDVSVDGASYDDYRTARATVDGSSFRQATGDAKLGWTPAQGHRLQLQGQLYGARDIGWPGMPSQDMSIPEEDRYTVALDYGWQRGGSIVDALSARAYRQRLDHHMVMRMQMSGEMGPMTSVTDASSWSTTSGARVQARLAPAGAAHIDVGMEATEWAAEATRWTETTSAMGEPDRVTLHTWPGVRLLDVGAFAQGELGLGTALTLSAGARLDHVRRRADDTETHTEWIGTGNVGARAQLGGGFSARTTFGIGYRNPDPTELFGLAIRPDGFLYRGNAELRTETNRNVELSLAFDQAGYGASVTAFRNALHDLIAAVLVPGETVGGRAVRSYENVARARIEGVSGSAYLAASRNLRVDGSATWTRGSRRPDGEPLAQMPPLQGTLTARLTPGRLVDWVEVGGYGASEQTRVDTAVGERATPAWATMHVRTGFALAGSSVTLGVENLLDQYYRSHLDNPGVHQPGRNLFVRVTRAF